MSFFFFASPLCLQVGDDQGNLAECAALNSPPPLLSHKAGFHVCFPACFFFFLGEHLVLDAAGKQKCIDSVVRRRRRGVFFFFLGPPPFGVDWVLRKARERERERRRGVGGGGGE